MKAKMENQPMHQLIKLVEQKRLVKTVPSI
jgi:hypothetical protein